ncbi:hypothetical protein GW915_07955 [bacterium]|nr:hypothetical protein [bacterium]
MKNVFLCLFSLSLIFSSHAQKVSNDGCQTCVPQDVADVYAEADAVLVVRAKNIPNRENPVGQYTVLRTLKAKEGVSVPKSFSLRATFDKCKRGLFLPPGSSFVVFLNKDEDFHLLPCRAREIEVENDKIKLNDEEIKVSAISNWFEQRAVPAKRENDKKDSVTEPVVRNFCIQSSDCTLRHVDCLVHECACPVPVNKKWFPECGQQVKTFSTDKNMKCRSCPKAELSCVRNRCVQVVKK